MREFDRETEAALQVAFQQYGYAMFERGIIGGNIPCGRPAGCGNVEDRMLVVVFCEDRGDRPQYPCCGEHFLEVIEMVFNEHPAGNGSGRVHLFNAAPVVL
ncbi:hypothetical protein ABT282_08690 [Streptomyces sp. NPDC000927]|uniref:hypothetical protein n=1 Tax=Streptomyces sp. NPDC000927 TaxID=3154371 RepID=UPI00332FBFFF